MTDLNGKVALVTGASRGIGFATAIELAKSGAHVIALARTVGGLEELDDEIQKVGGSATLIPHDLMDLDGIDNIGAALNERYGKLDILVANAAMLGPITPIGHIDAKIFEKVMHLNVTATWRLIRSVEPLLAKSDSGRAAIITSGALYSCKPFWGAYAASKAAVDTLARVWAAEVEKRGILVNTVNPGATRTTMRAQAMPGENADALPLAAEVAAKIIPIFASNTTETGMLYDVRQERFLSYQSPN